MKIDMEIVEKMLEDVTFYENIYDRSVVYAEYTKPNGSIWLNEVESEDFQAFLRIMYSERLDSDDELPAKRVLRRIRDEALTYCKNRRIEVHFRLAGNLEDGIEYFLADEKHRTVRITSGGQEIFEKSKYKFTRHAGILQQVLPAKSEENIFDLLKPFVNLSGDSFTLFTIWLIQAFCSGSHYCLFLSAEMGSGKSMLTQLIGQLLDPSPAEKCLLPATKDDLETFLSNHYLCSFDNVSTISKEYSDTFCVAVTGGSVARRQKFADKKMVYLPLHNVLVINGIGIAPTESDLAERSLFFNLKKLTSKELRPGKELEDAFEVARPRILGCIFDILSAAMNRIDGIIPKAPPRMGDAYKEMIAIAEALGITEDELKRLLGENTDAMNLARTADPVVEAVAECMEKHGKRKLEGSSSDIFSKVCNSYSGKKSLLPPNSSAFSKKLNHLSAPLRAAGFRFLIDDTGVSSNRITIIKEKNTDSKR